MRVKDEEALQSSYNVYAKEIVDRTMNVPGRAVAEAVDLARETGTPMRKNRKPFTTTVSSSTSKKAGFSKKSGETNPTNGKLRLLLCCAFRVV